MPACGTPLRGAPAPQGPSEQDAVMRRPEAAVARRRQAGRPSCAGCPPACRSSGVESSARAAMAARPGGDTAPGPGCHTPRALITRVDWMIHDGTAGQLNAAAGTPGPGPPAERARRAPARHWPGRAPRRPLGASGGPREAEAW